MIMHRIIVHSSVIFLTSHHFHSHSLSKGEFMLKCVKNGRKTTTKCFSRITPVFRAVKPPRSGPSETALRLRSLPEGGPPLGENFSELLVKINDFLMCIIVYEMSRNVRKVLTGKQSVKVKEETMDNY